MKQRRFFCASLAIILCMLAAGAVQVVQAKQMMQTGANLFVQTKSSPAVLQNESKIFYDPSDQNFQPIGLVIFLRDKELRFAVFEDITQQTLRYGVGHAAASAPLGAPGNCVLYGHRDSAFRVLCDLKQNDTVTIECSKKLYTYIVQKTYVTFPEDSAIFEEDTSGRLTLVTCYPFLLVGPANDRYVVVCSLA